MIGSLDWDGDAVRQAWRESRLAKGGKVGVRLPIHYGRAASTRGNTFTMCYGGGMGDALVIPCRNGARNLDMLLAEAEWLWRAETKGSAPAGAIHGRTGTVCAIFRDLDVTGALAGVWSNRYNGTKPPVVPMVNDGRLGLAWPVDRFGRPVDFDVLLGTATLPNRAGRGTEFVADCWMQSTNEERYFFKNVERGIRTTEDAAIWARMSADPQWAALMRRKYPAATALLEP